MTACRFFFNRTACHWVLLYALWEWGFWESGEHIYLPCSSAKTSHGYMAEHNTNVKVWIISYNSQICTTVKATWNNILENMTKIACIMVLLERYRLYIFSYDSQTCATIYIYIYMLIWRNIIMQLFVGITLNPRNIHYKTAWNYT